MLTIAKENEIRHLLEQDPITADNTIAQVAGVSRISVQRIRRLVETVEKLGTEKSKQVRKLILQGLSFDSIEVATSVSIENIQAIQRYYFLQPRKSGHLVGRCPTCGSMMFDGDYRLQRTLTKKSGRLLPPVISEEQAVALYRTVVDFRELDRLCIVTNPLFYYLARRAEKILGEIHGDEEGVE